MRPFFAFSIAALGVAALNVAGVALGAIGRAEEECGSELDAAHTRSCATVVGAVVRAVVGAAAEDHMSTERVAVATTSPCWTTWIRQVPAVGRNAARRPLTEQRFGVSDTSLDAGEPIRVSSRALVTYPARCSRAPMAAKYDMGVRSRHLRNSRRIICGVIDAIDM